MKKINLIFAFLFLLVGNVFAQTGKEEYGDCAMFGMMSGSFGYAGMIFGWIFQLLVAITIIIFIVWMIKQIQKK